MSDDFLKIDDKTPDDRGWNHDKPVVDRNAGVFQHTVRLPAYTKQDEGGGRRLALATTAQRSPLKHRRTALKANLLTFIERLEFRGGPE